jgi:hypothetical protein
LAGLDLLVEEHLAGVAAAMAAPTSLKIAILNVLA